MVGAIPPTNKVSTRRKALFCNYPDSGQLNQIHTGHLTRKVGAPASIHDERFTCGQMPPSDDCYVTNVSGSIITILIIYFYKLNKIERSKISDE